MSLLVVDGLVALAAFAAAVGVVGLIDYAISSLEPEARPDEHETSWRDRV